MTRILVIGKYGQVAQALGAAGRADLTCLSREQADLSDAASLWAAMKAHKPQVVINAGGFTKVDAAESESEAARVLNAEGPAHLAQICAGEGAVLVHMSTDCVFDGMKDAPYTNADGPNPLSIYGRTKLDGELAVRAAAPEASIVVRVCWVFSHYAHNFVHMMLTLARTRDAVTVVRDQYGYPSYAPGLAEGLIRIADRAAEPGFRDWGTYHLAGTEETDRASMARRIFEISARQGGPVAKVNGVLTADYPTPARRPLNARLDSRETARVFGTHMPDWIPGLEQTVQALL